MAKRKTSFKPRITKRINNLSRAINKIDDSLKRGTIGIERTIQDIKPGINTVKYTIDGVQREVRYDRIEYLSKTEQGALGKQLSVDRYNLRQERALQQLREKGKISWQFKKSIEEDNPALLQSINELQETMKGSDPEAVAQEFSKQDLITGENWEMEADSFFQSGKGTPELFDFYQPGTAGGFTELNIFTWNAYKTLRGI